MKLAIMQPYLFPYIGYYQAIHAADKYILYENVKYSKGSYVNRNRILIANGKPDYFSVPLSNQKSYMKISKTQIDNYTKWKTKFLRIIYYNYKKCQHFDETFSLIEDILRLNTTFISELNARCVVDVSKYLGISTQIITDVEEYNYLEEKLDCLECEIEIQFPDIKLEKYDRKMVRIIEICRRENAKVYINAIGGQKLYRKDEFDRNNIELLFVKTDEITYKQRSKVFYPNLSIIDVLMNCGKENTKEMLHQYALI